jgi:hypothetical protein
MNFNRLIPELSVLDFNRSLMFYTQILGFSIEFQRLEHKFAFLNLEGSQIMIEQHNGYWNTGSLEYSYGRGMNLAMQVERFDNIIESIQKHKHQIKFGPKGKLVS